MIKYGRAWSKLSLSPYGFIGFDHPDCILSPHDTQKIFRYLSITFVFKQLLVVFGVICRFVKLVSKTPGEKGSIWKKLKEDQLILIEILKISTRRPYITYIYFRPMISYSPSYTCKRFHLVLKNPRHSIWLIISNDHSNLKIVLNSLSLKFACWQQGDRTKIKRRRIFFFKQYFMAWEILLQIEISRLI